MQGLSDGAAPQLLSRGQRGYGTIVLVRCIQCILVDMTLDAPKIVQYTAALIFYCSDATGPVENKCHALIFYCNDGYWSGTGAVENKCYGLIFYRYTEIRYKAGPRLRDLTSWSLLAARAS